MKYTIRPLGLSDSEPYLALVNEIKDEGTYLFATLRFTIDDTRKYIAAHEKSGNPVLGAFDADGALLGWIDINVGGIQELAHIGTLGMGVRKDARGRGLGSALMDACIVQARSLGLEKIELEVFASNEAARALYAKKGFFEEGTRLKKRKFEGRYDDLVCMGLFVY